MAIAAYRISCYWCWFAANGFLCFWHVKDSMALNPQANTPAIPDRALGAFLDQLHRLVLDESITAARQLEAGRHSLLVRRATVSAQNVHALPQDRVRGLTGPACLVFSEMSIITD